MAILYKLLRLRGQNGITSKPTWHAKLPLYNIHLSLRWSWRTIPANLLSIQHDHHDPVHFNILQWSTQVMKCTSDLSVKHVNIQFNIYCLVRRDLHLPEGGAGFTENSLCWHYLALWLGGQRVPRFNHKDVLVDVLAHLYWSAVLIDF